MINCASFSKSPKHLPNSLRVLIQRDDPAEDSLFENIQDKEYAIRLTEILHKEYPNKYDPYIYRKICTSFNWEDIFKKASVMSLYTPVLSYINKVNLIKTTHYINMFILFFLFAELQEYKALAVSSLSFFEIVT